MLVEEMDHMHKQMGNFSRKEIMSQTEILEEKQNSMVADECLLWTNLQTQQN